MSGAQAMDLLVETLRVVREIRDWANRRARRSAGTERTRLALERAVDATEAELALDREAPSLPPIGPPEATPPPPKSEPLFDVGRLDPHAVSAVRRLRRNGYAAYLVGGCVRDLLLGFQPKDFDVSTDARPEEIKSLFRNSRIIGRRFRLVHLYFRGGKIIEVSTFRSNARVDDDEDDLLIRRDNVFGTEEEDALRRDFTINGLFYDIIRGRIIDHVGGLEDVRRRYLRMIGNPDIRLREDPVRILRAVRFAAKADLTVDPDLADGIETHRADLARCAPARLLEEFLKLLRAGYAARTFALLDEWSILEILLPELKAYFRGELPIDGPAGQDGALNRARTFAHLEALDVVTQRGPVDDCVVIGALLYPPIADLMENAEAKELDRNRVVTDFLSSIGSHVTLTKRLTENLRQAFGAQRHLGRTKRSRRRRRTSTSALMQRPFFASALHLYEIRQRALELPLDDVIAWQRRAHREHVDVGPLLPEADRRLAEGDDDPTTADESAEGAERPRPSGSRRSRRRGRRKPKGSASGSAEGAAQLAEDSD